jgi:hypothetical protein
MKAQERWDHHLHQTVPIVPRIIPGTIKTGNKTAKTQKATNKVANYSRDAA